MYMTHQERLEAAKRAWEVSQAQQAKLGRKMDRLDRKNVPICTVGYELLCEEIELVRCQYAAVVLNTDRLWQQFEKLSEQTVEA